MPTLVEPLNPNRIQDSCCGKCNVSAPHDEHGIALTGPLRGLHVDEGNTIGFGSVLVDAWLVVRGVDPRTPAGAGTSLSSSWSLFRKFPGDTTATPRTAVKKRNAGARTLKLNNVVAEDFYPRAALEALRIGRCHNKNSFELFDL